MTPHSPSPSPAHSLGSSADWAAAPFAPHAGSGTLARLGGVVLLVASTDPAAVAPLLDQAQMVAANGGDGRQLVRGFALQLSSGAGDEPAFAALAPHGNGLAVIVSGDASVTVGGETISGAGSLSWVERLVPWPVAQLVATVDPGGTPLGALYDLRAGVIPAGGFSVSVDETPTMAMSQVVGDVASMPDPEPTPAPAPVPMPVPVTPPMPEPVTPPTPEPTPAPPPAPPAPVPPTPTGDRPVLAAMPDAFASFDSVKLSDLEDDEPVTPLPIVADQRDVVASGVVSEVRGVFCKNRHFNDPRVLFCAVCGINMVQQTPVLVNGERPPLGVVVLDDGAVFQLDTDYLLGRDPDADDRVRQGDCRGISIIDTSNMVSRVHARLELRGWDVVLVDNTSTNGTFLNSPKAVEWRRMASGGEEVLTPGTRVRIGHRTLAFNTHGGQSAEGQSIS
ncbi:FHA domain-containing protein [Nocardioides psychrotolerans]|uniref:FHA domain-containing protein n=1 Tax=Nocardioides psychrotolerans TaxID=1005945 RepID=UPI00313846F6